MYSIEVLAPEGYGYVSCLWNKETQLFSELKAGQLAYADPNFQIVHIKWIDGNTYEEVANYGRSGIDSHYETKFPFRQWEQFTK